MSRVSVVSGVAVFTSVAAIAWATWSMVHPLRLPAPPAVMTGRAERSSAAVARLSDSAVSAAIHAAGFRLTRSLAPVAFNNSDPVVEPTPEPPKPALALVGLVLGRTSTLLLTGIPGSSGTRLLALGDTAGGLKVRSISPSRVIVAGYDTVWTFRPLEEPK